jgi:hypothetical protein
MEGKEVTILTPAYPVPDKLDLIHPVDPGFSPGTEYFAWGAERRHLRSLPDPGHPST